MAHWGKLEKVELQGSSQSERILNNPKQGCAQNLLGPQAELQSSRSTSEGSQGSPWCALDVASLGEYPKMECDYLGCYYRQTCGLGSILNGLGAQLYMVPVSLGAVSVGGLMNSGCGCICVWEDDELAMKMDWCTCCIYIQGEMFNPWQRLSWGFRAKEVSYMSGYSRIFLGQCSWGDTGGVSQP